jgi:hypothetical protein
MIHLTPIPGILPMSVKHLGHDDGSADGRCRKVARALAMLRDDSRVGVALLCSPVSPIGA